MTVATASPPGPAAPAPAQAPIARVPFVAAAHEHMEPAFQFTVTPGANGIEQGPFDVPAYGYLRSIVLELTASGGTLGAGVLSPDFPWNIFERISLTDVN